MDNGLTFRFEVAEIKKLIDGLDSGAKDYILITYYLDPSPGNKKAYLVAKAEAFTQSKDEEISLPAGDPAYGCPVPLAVEEYERKVSILFLDMQNFCGELETILIT